MKRTFCTARQCAVPLVRVVACGKDHQREVQHTEDDVCDGEGEPVRAEHPWEGEEHDLHRRDDHQHHDPGDVVFRVEPVGETGVARPRPPQDGEHQQDAPQADPRRIAIEQPGHSRERENEHGVDEQLERRHRASPRFRLRQAPRCATLPLAIRSLTVPATRPRSHLRIDPVLVEQVDCYDAESADGAVDDRSNVFGSAVESPPARPRSHGRATQPEGRNLKPVVSECARLLGPVNLPGRGPDECRSSRVN